MSSHYREWIVGAALVLCAGAAVGADLTGVEAAKARIAHMKALGGAAKALGDQLKSGAPDPVVVKAEAAKIDAAAKALPTWFPAGSGPSSGAETHALPLIWSDPAGFAAKQRALALAAGKLDAAASAGDMAAVGPAMQAVGGACKGCHETYKAKERS